MRFSIVVRTGLYWEVHREEPRGVRNWGFALGSTTEVHWVLNEEYSKAKRKAIRQAQQRKVSYIIVLPYDS